MKVHVFTISLKFIQENIMGALISSESECFHYLLYKNVMFPENIYVINMSEDTPECTKLHNLKKCFSGEHISQTHIAITVLQQLQFSQKL